MVSIFAKFYPLQHRSVTIPYTNTVPNPKNRVSDAYDRFLPNTHCRSNSPMSIYFPKMCNIFPRNYYISITDRVGEELLQNSCDYKAVYSLLNIINLIGLYVVTYIYGTTKHFKAPWWCLVVHLSII